MLYKKDLTAHCIETPKNDYINSLNKRIGIGNSKFEKFELIIERDINCEYCR